MKKLKFNDPESLSFVRKLEKKLSEVPVEERPAMMQAIVTDAAIKELAEEFDGEIV